jgi:hypothetical protein
MQLLLLARTSPTYKRLLTKADSQMLSHGSGSGTSTRSPVYTGSEIGIFAVAVGSRGAGWAAAVFVLAVLCFVAAQFVYWCCCRCAYGHWLYDMSLTKGVSS